MPLVVGDTMYIVGPWPNTLYALDATDGELKWSFTPPKTHAAQGVACCDTVNRGAAYYDGKIFYNTLDDHTVAVDAKTGKEVWHTKLGDISQGETMTMAPLVVKGKVLVGNSGGEMGVRGWLTALDAESGKIVWRAYSTGPDKDVLIGPDFKAPYDWMKGTDLGVKTWPKDHWQHGGGTVWGWISYDPELNLIYYGTSNPGPWNSNQRPGDNLWTATIFARDPDTGQAKWAYQTSPHDLWDHDSINEVVLLDLKIDGKMRKVLVRPGRTGYMYVIDRTNGKLVSAKAYDKVTAYLGVDMQTGRIKPNPEKEPRLGRTVEDVCPASPGTKDWQPTAWSPRTKLLYVPHQHICMNFATAEVGYIAGTPYVGATVDMYATPPRRLSRRVSRLGPGRPEAGLVDQGTLPRLQRHGGHRRRRRLLRNHGSLVQGGQRQDRRAAVAVPGAVRLHRPADHLHGQRWPSVRRHPLRCRRMVGCGCRRRA